MIELPTVNSLVHVVIREGVDFRSRVEDVEGALLTIAAPLEALDLDLPPDEFDVDVFWTRERTRFVSPMRMVERTRDHVQRWRLVSTGEPRRCNRRQYVRGEDGGPITIAVSRGESAPQPLAGSLVDIGEGGVRCRIPPSDLAPDDRVGLRFTVAGQVVDVEGTIHSIRQYENEKNVDVVIEYMLEERLAQAVRKHVMELQLIERRRQRAREERQRVG